MMVKLQTEHHLEFLGLKGGCTGLSESTHVKMPNCWKSHALAHIKLELSENITIAPLQRFSCSTMYQGRNKILISIKGHNSVKNKQKINKNIPT